jgi:hypothetical protein
MANAGFCGTSARTGHIIWKRLQMRRVQYRDGSLAIFDRKRCLARFDAK